MKAIQYLDAQKIEVRDIPMPQVKEGWGLIKVSHAGICGTDLNIYMGTHPRAKAPLPVPTPLDGRFRPFAAPSPDLPSCRCSLPVFLLGKARKSPRLLCFYSMAPRVGL